MKRPLLINMLDDMSCETCVITNVLYMYGLIDTPDTRWVDRQLGRKPGEPLDGGAEIDLLLQMGFFVHQIIKKPFDNERFLREGITYWKKFLGLRWTRSHTRYWTEERIAKRQRVIARSIQIRQHFRNQLTEQTGEHPTVDDIRQQLAQGRVVDASFGKGAICHATLVWKYDAQHLTTYYPSERSSFLTLPAGRFSREGWNPHLGINAYWYPAR